MKIGQVMKSNPLELALAGLFLILLLLPKFMALYIGVLILTITYFYIKKEIKFHFSWGSIGFVLFYLAYLIGTIWTQNAKLANFYTVNKLAFIIFPFLLAFKKKDFNLNIVLSGLILATLLSFLRDFIGGIPCYLHHFSFPYCFMRSHLSTVIHPTYMSVFAILSFLAVYKMHKEGRIGKTKTIVLIGVFVLYTVLLLSSSGLLFLLILLCGFVIKSLWKRVNHTLILIGLPLFLIGFVFIAPRTPYLKEEVKYTKAAIEEYLNSPNDFATDISAQASGSEIRLLMWTVASEEIKANPLGVGTGNVDIYLGKNLRGKGLDKIAEKEYNPHNQFLQTTLEIGVFGGVILVLIFVFGFIDARRTGSWLIFLLFACMFLNSLFESMLQHQAAIVFFPFMYLLLLIDFNSRKLVSA